MKITNKKECPKCHSDKVFETKSGVGSGLPIGTKRPTAYSVMPLKDVICRCLTCNTEFLYRK